MCRRCYCRCAWRYEPALDRQVVVRCRECLERDINTVTDACLLLVGVPLLLLCLLLTVWLLATC